MRFSEMKFEGGVQYEKTNQQTSERSAHPVMVLGLLPMGQVAYAVDTLPTISNVVISDAGVLT